MEYLALFVAAGLGFVLGLLVRWWGLIAAVPAGVWTWNAFQEVYENGPPPTSDSLAFTMIFTAPMVIGVGLGVLVARRAGWRSRLLLIPATVGIALVLIGLGLGGAERWDASGEHFWWVIFLTVGALILGVLARRALDSREGDAPKDA
jgi:hypothetical protein